MNPSNAVSSGYRNDGEEFLVGRGWFRGSLSIGKVHPARNGLYLAYYNREYKVDDYEVLVHDNESEVTTEATTKISTKATTEMSTKATTKATTEATTEMSTEATTEV